MLNAQLFNGIANCNCYIKEKAFQSVTDNELGDLLFPVGDTVMAPTIHANWSWEENE
jgi:hypothetical protein